MLPLLETIVKLISLIKKYNDYRLIPLYILCCLSTNCQNKGKFDGKNDTAKGLEQPFSSDSSAFLGEGDFLFDNGLLAEFCSEGVTKQSVKKTITFPARTACSFGSEGNGNVLQGIITARESQTNKVVLEQNSPLCNIS
ncbi:MAG: hypothetical protein CMP10_21150, partial [Zetaproteobacteria bacterium]|nr:hypothetical protein [Pseudobdellovibrionaceae bacterium]